MGVTGYEAQMYRDIEGIRKALERQTDLAELDALERRKATTGLYEKHKARHAQLTQRLWPA